VPNANYPAAESSRLTAGNVDLLVANPLNTPSYASSSASNDAQLASAGQFLDLSKEPFIKNFSSSVLQAQEFKGKDYTVPTGVSYSTGVFYNKAIFQKYGLSVPTTWSQFTALSDKLKAAGVTPLGIGGKDSWPGGLPMLAAVEGAYPTAADRSKLAEDLWKQKVKLTDADQVGILDKVQTVYSYAQQGFAGVPYASVPGEFASGQFAMTPDGTWNETTIAQAVGSKFGIGYFPLPTSENASDNQLLGGKVEIKLAVAANAKNKTAALAWLNFFSTPKNYELFLGDAGFAPAVTGVAAGAFLDSIAKYTSTFEPAWDQIWTANNKAGNAALFPYNYTALTPMGTDSAKQAAAAAQQAWSSAF
jgi:raffinose/stachyose/melibiose transport system substrate-binding protein